MKKILVPTDFSECANAATQVAMAIAKKTGAEIYFVHLYSDDSFNSHVPLTEFHRALPDEKRSEIGHAREALNSRVADAQNQGIVAKGEFVLYKGEEQLERYIKPFGIDLVIMGSNGARGLKEILVGSNTQRLIWKSPVPVLVIKNRPEKLEIHNIVFVSDFQVDFISPFEAIIELAEIWQAQIHLLYVNTQRHFRETSEVLADMKRYMHQFQKIPYTPHIYNAHDEERGIHQFAKANQIDLIAITIRDKTEFIPLMHSIAECLVNHEQTPVLAINVDA